MLGRTFSTLCSPPLPGSLSVRSTHSQHKLPPLPGSRNHSHSWTLLMKSWTLSGILNTSIEHRNQTRRQTDYHTDRLPHRQTTTLTDYHTDRVPHRHTD